MLTDISKNNLYNQKKELSEQLTKNLLIYPEALDYLNQRGINKSLIQNYSIGFCPPFFNHYDQKQIVISPLMKGRITIPIKDTYGNIIAFAGRQFDPMKDIVERTF